MSDICLVCTKNTSNKLAGNSRLVAKSSISNGPITKISVISKILANNGIRLSSSSKIKSESNLQTITNIKHSLHGLNNPGVANISSKLKINGNLKAKVSSESDINNIFTDKFAGHIDTLNSFDNFTGSEKLYPTKDIITVYNNSRFVDKLLNSGNLYSNIDEGVVIGNYTKYGKNGKFISDEKTSFIQPSSIFTSGDFRYKCEVSKPSEHAENSFLFIRAAAPISTYAAHIPPQYKLHNIKLEDPSGNLIIKYKDITLRGDANYNSNYVNFTTYISEPETNNLLLRSWDSNYPLMEYASGYTLNIDFNIQCLDEPFNPGFDKGYEDTCVLDYDTLPVNFELTPSNSIRISAIEIVNSGDACLQCISGSGRGVKKDNYLPFNIGVDSIGRRITRRILPVDLITSGTNLSIYPESTTRWISSPDSFSNIYNNASFAGSQILTSKLQNDSSYDYITLDETYPILDSGRLTLRFSHQPPLSVEDYTNGAFALGYARKDYNASEFKLIEQVDNFFVVDEVSLRVVAKKAVGSRDYALDVIGYSDDKILNITPKLGAFIQNKDEIDGNIPQVSGFKSIDDFGISTETISDKDQYYSQDIALNDGKDHYILSTSPIVNTTTFAEYIIPLQIVLDNVELGTPIDYSMSSYFENLYIDLFPIPSGASISTVELVVTYKPSNGMNMYTFGRAEKDIALRNITIYPTKDSNYLVSTYPLSSIENIPQAFTTPSSIKTNYSRRWRGNAGTISYGPYNPNAFDFSFFNPQENHPFLNGYFTFNYDQDNWIISNPSLSTSLTSGELVGNYDRISNHGLRFNNSGIFNTPYRTLDWTKGDTSHPLYGKIADAFDNALRIGGSDSHIIVRGLNDSEGFSIYTRFVPDSGNINIFNSGIIFSKWNDGSDLEYMLAYENGYLCGYATDSLGNIIKAKDNTLYHEYQYPISTILTYRNDRFRPSLNLYIDNELKSSWNPERSVSQTFGYSAITESDLIIGHCQSSGIGMKMFLTEFGISTFNDLGTNLVNTFSPNKLYKQVDINKFFDGIRLPHYSGIQNNRYDLPRFIDNEVVNWHLGDFKYCEFSPDFDFLTAREGRDYILHSLSHSGSGYYSATNTSLPNNINLSGISYHTQIENDFLRFSLSDTPESFISASQRISKNLPRGYNFVEDAFVVDTILEYETDNSSIQPKLIVSLYSENQDPAELPSKINWGLINRSIHDIEVSGCIQKLSSKFTYNDLVNISEPWANFDIDIIRREFDHKYYSTDVNNMFLQYDLVYPSGTSFNSTLKLHTVNVRLEDSLVKELPLNNSLNICTSGESVWRENINLFVDTYGISSSGMSLNMIGDYTPVASSSMNLLASGAYHINNSGLKLFTLNVNSVDSSSAYLYGLFGSNDVYLGPNLFVGGRDNRFDEQYLSLMVNNTVSSQSSSDQISLYTQNVISSDTILDSTNLYILASRELSDRFPRESMSLYVEVPQLTDFYKDSTLSNINLYINGYDQKTYANESCSLFTINYPTINYGSNLSSIISWNSTNTGKNISVDDNSYAFVDADDDIRGVDIICYGGCPTGSCQEEVLNIHGQDWSGSSTCVDGGILRAKKTYTNLSSPSGSFKHTTSSIQYITSENENIIVAENNALLTTEAAYSQAVFDPMPYSGHFYGIRKYDGLVPNAPYNVTIEGKTGTGNSIELPLEFTEIDYGSDNYVNYSGVKFISDNREENNKFGRSVSIRNDLVAIGSPFETLSYQEYDNNNDLISYNLDEAGCVYLYRRDERPNGYSWPDNNIKSPWQLESKITLPSGLLKDYVTKTTSNTIDGITLPTSYTVNTWNVGGEGRQFGHSVALGINEELSSFQENRREVLVVGGPSSKWEREFEELSPSSVQIGLMIFTDEFKPTLPKERRSIYSYLDVLDAIKNKDILFKYFGSPSIKFDVKLIICEPTLNATNVTSYDFPEPKPDFIVKKRIERNVGLVSDPEYAVRSSRILSGIKEAFHEAFPYDESKIHNNIPPIFGLYVDDSESLGKEAINPALNQFINYYKEYSFASGLRDFNNVRSSGALVEFIPENDPENWVLMSTTILDNVLDTGRLVSENQIRFLTSGVGPQYFNDNLSEFNFPPESGGRVYVFEKESGSWNLIQEIRSPNVTYGLPDRFGHAVAISRDTEVLAIGSPYIDDACKVYEYRPEEKDRLYSQLYSWVEYKNSATGGIVNKYSSLVDQYPGWQNTYGTNYANQILYSKLDSTDKFEARRYLNISEYENIFTYRYSDIGLYSPTWSFIPEHFAPTSRLGYSIAINDDGTILAVGAPTDSFNQWEDGNVYYKNSGYEGPSSDAHLNGIIKPSWRSNTNAGAVRLFESRKYYPHDSVVEFGKFGNMQESMNFPEDSGHFNYIASVFNDLNFRKTEFTEVEIPQDAGLAFIITPEVDALSDEVADNILNWLALGDRNLVLVGNDPVWEKNGLYFNSNQIINKILSRLNSRMRLFEARNKYESLSSGCSVALPSFIPDGATKSYVQPVVTKAYGVADIRMVFEGINFTMPCNTSENIINSKCELPIKHLGDLRAQWYETCYNCQGVEISYPVNWPQKFGTYVPPCCDESNTTSFNLQNQEPVPLMVAGDYVTRTINIPASPAVSGLTPIYKEESTIRLNFNEDKLFSEAAFIWDAENTDYSYLNVNETNIISPYKFIVPTAFEDRQSLLLASGQPQTEIIKSSQEVSDYSYYCLEEPVEGENSSKIIFIAGVETESQDALLSGGGDKNLLFYFNLVYKENGSQIAQLGGWTGRTSFIDAYNGSILYDKLSYKNLVVENAPKVNDKYDVIWIANPIGLPSAQDIFNIKAWLSLGNKKLIITYDNTISQAINAKKLSDLLNSKIKPLYLNVLDQYAVGNGSLSFNTNHPVSMGHSVKSSITEFSYGTSFIPLARVNGVTPICYNTTPINDLKFVNAQYWRFNSGLTKVSFPSVAGSGYKLFITTISETPFENQPLFIGTQNVSRSVDSDSSFDYEFIENNSITVGDVYAANFGVENTPNTYSFNVKASNNSNTINFYIANNSPRIDVNTSDYYPKTVRLLSISGVMLPIEEFRSTYPVFDRYEYYRISDPKPAETITEVSLSPISNDNSLYCPDACVEELGNQLIADGPVIVAQEIEHFSDFKNGVARSRITLISDSSLVQGQCMGDDQFRATPESVQFLRSLYPFTYFPDTNNGRQYTSMTKLLSPERGSPQKYKAIVNNSGIDMKFGGGNSTSLSLSSFDDKESMYDPLYVKRPEEPWGKYASAEEVEQKKREQISIFNALQYSQGGTAMFSGVYNNKLYRDAGIGGGMPEIMKDTGFDYLDLNNFPSGYPGDLFGYSVAIYKDKVLVGSPFAAFSKEDIQSWNDIINGGYISGVELSYNGGAGAAYLFERTGNGSGLHGQKTPWEFIQKFRPSTINIGTSSGVRIISDQFGRGVDICSDIVLISAPGHDYSVMKTNGSGDFIRRCFNDEFNIPSRTIIDLGSSGNRNIHGSGSVVINRGSIFTYENKIVDWTTKSQKWTYVEKIDPVDGHEDDLFGSCISLDRSNRTDSDYVFVGGSENHDYSANDDNYVSNAGMAYSHDIMLRSQSPVLYSSGAYIDSKVFGYTDSSGNPNIRLLFNNSVPNTTYNATGIVYSNNEGEIFLEASGQDPATRGFIEHRPYIHAINGSYNYGVPNSGNMPLFIDGKKDVEQNMNIFTYVDDIVNVYNTLGLYSTAIYGFASGIPSGLMLYVHTPDPTSISESGLCLSVSGIGIIPDTLNMRIRGK